jgi:hypothetical protein
MSQKAEIVPPRSINRPTTNATKIPKAGSNKGSKSSSTVEYSKPYHELKPTAEWSEDWTVDDWDEHMREKINNIDDYTVDLRESFEHYMQEHGSTRAVNVNDDNHRCISPVQVITQKSILEKMVYDDYDIVLGFFSSALEKPQDDSEKKKSLTDTIERATDFRDTFEASVDERAAILLEQFRKESEIIVPGDRVESRLGFLDELAKKIDKEANVVFTALGKGAEWEVDDDLSRAFSRWEMFSILLKSVGLSSHIWLVNSELIDEKDLCRIGMDIDTKPEVRPSKLPHFLSTEPQLPGARASDHFWNFLAYQHHANALTDVIETMKSDNGVKV